MLLYVFERVMARMKSELEVNSLYILYINSSGFWLDPVYCPAVRRGEAHRNGHLITPMSSSKKSRQPPSLDDDDDNTVAMMMGSSMDTE